MDFLNLHPQKGKLAPSDEEWDRFLDRNEHIWHEIADRRTSDKMPKLPSDEFKLLDDLLDRHGLRKVLIALRVLCDSRQAHNDPDALLKDYETSDKWKRAADELELMAVSERMNLS